MQRTDVWLPGVRGGGGDDGQKVLASSYKPWGGNDV